MKTAAARLVPWLLLVVSVLAYAASNWLASMSAVPLEEAASTPGSGVVLGAYLAYSAVGAVVASRRPRNDVGWLLLVMGGLGQVQGLASEAVSYAASPGATAPWWFLDPWIMAPLRNLWVVSFSAVGLLLFIFPNGRLFSRRSLPALAIAAFTVVVGLLTSGSVTRFTAMRFPLLEAVFGAERAADLYEQGQGLSGVSLLILLVAGAISMVRRLRAATGVERQQMKWFAYAAVLLAVVFVGTAVAFFSPLRSLDPAARIPPAMFGGIPFVLALVAVPVGAGIAILRYRLYDIDLVIERTLIYGGLTATLGALYVGSVVLLQALLRPLTAGSELAIAGSTLLIAGLFQPVRRRIQDAVDRRFYRRKYDAAATVAAFSQRLRQEVDLDQLSGELVGVVRETMQPRRVSLWLRERRG